MRFPAPKKTAEKPFAMPFARALKKAGNRIGRIYAV